MTLSNESIEAGTRDRILLAALSAFGHNDYAAVSVRSIVMEAGVNIAAVSYHFSGKKGLYLEVADYLAEHLNAGVRDELDRIESMLDTTEPAHTARLAGTLLGRLAEILLTGPLSEDLPGFIFREQSHPTEAFDILYRRFLAPVHRTLAGLVARTRGIERSSKEAMMLAHAMLGSVVVFRVARTTLQRRLGQADYSDGDISQIRELVQCVTLSILDHEDAAATVGENR